MLLGIVILLSFFFLYSWVDATQRLRRTYIAYAGCRVRLEYRYKRDIELLSAQGKEEVFKERNEEMCRMTEELYKEATAAHKALDQRIKWSPLRNTLLDKKVYEYEIAMSRFHAALDDGPLSISFPPMWPSFIDSHA